MAKMPEAEWLGAHHNNGYITRYDIVCIHTIVGNPPAHAAHFSIRSDGHVYQSRDTAFASAANYNGNHRIIAIENDDFGTEYGDWNTNNGHDVPAFTDIQCEAIAHTLVWCYRTHGIPLVACPDSKSSSRGIAYHRQGIDGNWAGYAYGGRVPGGELWSNKTGKVCPGDRRIKQLHEVIIPRARIIAGLDQEVTVTCSLNMPADRLLWQDTIARVSSLINLSANSGEYGDHNSQTNELTVVLTDIVNMLNSLAAQIEEVKQAVTGGFTLVPEGSITVTAETLPPE